jgi:hypothetical protein
MPAGDEPAGVGYEQWPQGWAAQHASVQMVVQDVWLKIVEQTWQPSGLRSPWW